MKPNVKNWSYEELKTDEYLIEKSIKASEGTSCSGVAGHKELLEEIKHELSQRLPFEE